MIFVYVRKEWKVLFGLNILEFDVYIIVEIVVWIKFVV